MRVLLDECVPRPLKRELVGHDVHTVIDMGWGGKTNGELLQLMLPAKFDAFLTVDQNLSYQQNLTAAGVAVIVLVARSNKLADLLPLVASALAALASAQPGAVVEIDH